MPIEQTYTIKDIYNLPDGQRAELIDGVMYDMAPSSRIHQKLVSRLTQSIGSYIKAQNGRCEVYPAPFAVFLNNDDKIYVELDISVICGKDKLSDRGCEGAPDWIINPAQETVLGFSFEGLGDSVQYAFSDLIESGIYHDFEIRIADLLK